MRKGTAVVSALVATAALAASWRAGAHPSSGVPGVHVVAAPPAAGSGPTATPRPSSSTSSGSASSGSASSGSTTSAATSPGGSRQHRYTGAVVSTPYGDVQVMAVTSGSRITDVKALQLTDANQRSRDISASASPMLRQEALQAQSASIDTVSGATYTSEGYRQSLQAALDQMHS